MALVVGIGEVAGLVDRPRRADLRRSDRGGQLADRQHELVRELVGRAHELANRPDVRGPPEGVIRRAVGAGDVVRVPGLEDGDRNRLARRGGKQDLADPRVDTAGAEVRRRARVERDRRIGEHLLRDSIGGRVGLVGAGTADRQPDLERRDRGRRQREQPARLAQTQLVAAAVARIGLLDIGDPVAPRRRVLAERRVARRPARVAHRERVRHEPAQLQIRPGEVAGISPASQIPWRIWK